MTITTERVREIEGALRTVYTAAGLRIVELTLDPAARTVKVVINVGSEHKTITVAVPPELLAPKGASPCSPSPPTKSDPTNQG